VLRWNCIKTSRLISITVFLFHVDLDFVCKNVFLVEKEDHCCLFEETIVANGTEEFERFVKSAITMEASKLDCFNEKKLQLFCKIIQSRR